MSGDKEEPMDVDLYDPRMQPHASNETADSGHFKMQPHASNAHEDEVGVTLSVEWPADVLPEKRSTKFQLALQSWVNKNSVKGDFKVLKVSKDGTALIRIKPSSAKSELQSGQVLISKNTSFKITSVNLTPLNGDTQMDNNASVLHPSHMSASQNEHGQPGKQNNVDSAAGDEAHACILPVREFWYVNHICKEEIQRIERENGVEIRPEVKVTFSVKQKDGNPDKASSEFTNLVQSHLSDFHSSSTPLKKVGPREWGDALEVMQKNDLKLLLTLSSEEITVFGPAQGKNAISKLLEKTWINTNTSDEESASSFRDTTEKRWRDMTWHGMSIKDPVINDGLTIEEDYWKLMTTSYSKDLEKIMAKFGVAFKESAITQGKTTIKAYYKRSGGNASMESHAVRALLRLYQKVATSPMSARGFCDSSKNLTSAVEESEGASAGSFVNGRSGGGATGGEDEEEICPICLDTFTKKTQLKCKHEFCEECLESSKKSTGAICPVCKDVFGLIEGDQPDGTMTWSYASYAPLHGFRDCGTIIINYDIPSGIQTQKHPKPGRRYHGISRTAYLPDNKEGKEVLHLLKKAFDQKLIFTVGMSRTTGMEDQVTWNDIHHKTSTTGGPQSFGYPDPGYLSRVKEELQAKGIK